MEINKVKSIMALNGDTGRDLAKILKITDTSAYNKLGGRNQFTVAEVETMAKYYKVNINYFFKK